MEKEYKNKDFRVSKEKCTLVSCQMVLTYETWDPDAVLLFKTASRFTAQKISRVFALKEEGNMNRRQTGQWIFFSMIALVLLFTAACGWMKNYGRLSVVYEKKDGVTIQNLVENWQENDVTYAGLSVSSPSAVMFDPKSDDRRLTHDKWVRVKDLDQLKTILNWIDSDPNFPPRLMKITGPDGLVYGYMYSYRSDVVMKVVDGRTLWVGDIPLPPFDYGPINP